MASSKSRSFNPFSFSPWPVTIVTSIVYLALVIPLLVVHHVVPSAPSTSPTGLNISEAWHDLEFLTDGYHPFNSHRNDEIHSWLLDRIHGILPASSVNANKRVPDVFVFDDLHSNLTFSGGSTGVYFESTNIIVYIRGAEDDQNNWWEAPNGSPATGTGGVLVNSHYDSVSTGFGATDDGVGVITCLQLIKYFTTPGHAPRKGLVVLFNNGEEDFLNGAYVYSQHPMSKFTHTFLNLEGAGAGGRAMLFRGTDTEVASFYQRTKHPFGSVLGGNGFDMGYIGSQTDYVVFNQMGLRGLDVAFYEPRARYHTDQDDARHTSKDSLWHMLSTAVATTEGLVSDSGSRFTGKPRDDGKVPSGSGTTPVFFDIFGDTFVVFRLHTLFALSATALIVAPLVLFFTSIALVRADKMYLFRLSVKLDDTERVPLHSLQGFFRFPFLFAIPAGVTVGLAYLMAKINPLIVHSSEYAVWSMFISAWIFLAWFVARAADSSRPSALHRVYTLTWMFSLAWALLVYCTVYENELHIGGVYFMFFYFVSVFFATWISYLELFSLPRKTEYAEELTQGWRGASSRPSVSIDGEDDEQAVEESTESSALLPDSRRTTFANYNRVTNLSPRGEEEIYEETKDPGVYGHEQAWSSRMPQWTWLLQFLILAPFNIVVLGSLALMITAALHQTGQDGGSPLSTYLIISVFTVFLFSPLLPFIHRFTHHVPMFLLFIFIGTLIYNLDAFPFSDSSRLKIFFVQEVDLDTGTNKASLTGIQPFIYDVVHSIPSSVGQKITCGEYRNREKCAWDGLAPHVIDDDDNNNDWISFNVTVQEEEKAEKVNTKGKGSAKARFEVSGKNTRACKITFDSPVSDYHVLGSAVDPKLFPHISPKKLGGREIRLWSREWENKWQVDVTWEPSEESRSSSTSASSSSLSGRVACIWSDNNHDGVIPALDEVRRYSPVWVAVTKMTDGLVEASRRFKI